MRAPAPALFLFMFLAPLLALAGPSPRNLRVGVIADVNGTGCQTKYPANSITAFGTLLGTQKLDLIISTGDAAHGECMTYSGTTPYSTVVKQMWEEYDAKFVKPARETEGVSLILSPGNHDAPFLSSASRDTFKAENAGFVRYWQQQKPSLDVTFVQAPGVPDQYPYYWAYTKEDVLFLVLQDTRTHRLANDVEQKKWLRALLRSPAARNARARIAFGHVPPYAVLDPSVGSKYSEILDKEQVGQPDSLMDLLLDNGVELLLVGHSHAPYPAELTRATDGKKIRILSMPCTHAARKLVTKTEVAPRGYAVLNIDPDNKMSLSLHHFADGKNMDLSYFPASIPVNDARISYKRMKELRR